MPDQVRHDEFGPFCETNNVWQFDISTDAGQKTASLINIETFNYRAKTLRH
jgi:hypothetical protein